MFSLFIVFIKTNDYLLITAYLSEPSPTGCRHWRRCSYSDLPCCIYSEGVLLILLCGQPAPDRLAHGPYSFNPTPGDVQ